MSEQNSTKQLGPRVDAKVADDFKQIVRFEYGKTRGTLGSAIEEALEMYIAKEVYAEIDRHGHLDGLVGEIDGDVDFQSRLQEYADEAGPEYLEVCNFLRGDASPQDARHNTPVLGNQTDAAQEWETLSPTALGEDTAHSDSDANDGYSEEMIRKVVQEEIARLRDE
ncbi:hypothetical protein [Halobaculum gomorrense]|uniref:Uncharacterized protein n=1 Tax=Halobaculum gomorrense TaxID=43928 RepID=A0A1M5UT20_9EURY|nr:hypothetical protein [Halobaculum gomorrense]SHH66121.1 hypothetical protein SAMN05443636_3127 [Halobaculum gomorrense]